MAVDNQFKETVDALFKGMNGVVSSKTVVGDAIHIGDTIILPLVDVSFAIGAGAFHADKKDRGAGGLGGKMIPSAVLVIQNGTTRLVNIKNQDTMTKILDMVPDVIDRFKSPSDDKMTEEDVADLLNEADSPENHIFIVKEEKAGTKMKRVFGFALFFVALGMVIMMFIPSIFIGILIVLLCLLVGYQLFCC